MVLTIVVAVGTVKLNVDDVMKNPSKKLRIRQKTCDTMVLGWELSRPPSEISCIFVAKDNTTGIFFRLLNKEITTAMRQFKHRVRHYLHRQRNMYILKIFVDRMTLTDTGTYMCVVITDKDQYIGSPNFMERRCPTAIERAHNIAIHNTTTDSTPTTLSLNYALTIILYKLFLYVLVLYICYESLVKCYRM